MDDLSPNDSETLGVYLPDEPEDVQQSDRKDRQAKSIAKPIIEDLLAWFDGQIDVSNSVTQLRETVKEFGCTVDEALISHLVVTKLLTAKRSGLRVQFLDEDEDV